MAGPTIAAVKAVPVPVPVTVTLVNVVALVPAIEVMVPANDSIAGTGTAVKMDVPLGFVSVAVVLEISKLPKGSLTTVRIYTV